MPFDEQTKNTIEHYINLIIPNDEWYEKEFDFILDDVIKKRIIKEFRNARKIYKFFEGMQSKDEFLEAEVRVQILMYASIYEAMIHYLLFDRLKDNEEVKKLLIHTIPKKISIPLNKKEKLQRELLHNGRIIIPMYYEESPKDITSVRFDEKCATACKIGLITDKLKKELIRIYELRNCLHMHAELRKGIEYELEMSLIAYRRMQPFREQVKKFFNK